MSVISVDTEVLNAQAGRVRATAERTSADLKAMRMGLAELQSTWRGSASASFQALITEWTSMQGRVEANLAGIMQALDQAAYQYRDVEQLNTQRFLA
ncbi:MULTISPECIES: WXG100 family type VII secretion target [Arthrobacter]|uniref:ESAT-6-like protein n=2 Tax=Arthrobacter TaxID=1663 RepID=A0ABU9KMG2_9MICC|nr:WXG100 family type VII secretion target [Arthrobacter sp. YJM1]MDP5227761.1 WXG100 family type VII secretion target [Arthrobacter sp. YJM1]